MPATTQSKNYKENSTDMGCKTKTHRRLQLQLDRARLRLRLFKQLIGAGVAQATALTSITKIERAESPAALGSYLAANVQPNFPVQTFLRIEDVATTLNMTSTYLRSL